jgi:hypothetical protein
VAEHVEGPWAPVVRDFIAQHATRARWAARDTLRVKREEAVAVGAAMKSEGASDVGEDSSSKLDAVVREVGRNHAQGQLTVVFCEEVLQTQQCAHRSANSKIVHSLTSASLLVV